jgi:hypothetical protein
VDRKILDEEETQAQAAGVEITAEDMEVVPGVDIAEPPAEIPGPALEDNGEE